MYIMKPLQKQNLLVSHSRLRKLASQIKASHWKAFAIRVRKRTQNNTIQKTDTPVQVVDKAIQEAYHKTKSKKKQKTKKQVMNTKKHTWTFHKKKVMSLLLIIITGFLYQNQVSKKKDTAHTQNTSAIVQPFIKKKHMTPRNIQENADRIFECYEKGWEPPMWSKDNIIALCKQHTVTCYYPSTSLESTAKRLLRQREPVNIAQDRSKYNDRLLSTFFGYRMGYYDDKTIPYRLKPNIAVYNTSPVKHHVSSINDWDEVEKMHFLHCIGYAFDNEKQTDYIEIIKNKNIESYTARLLHLYKNIFNIVFTCAKDHKLTNIALGWIGAGYFATLYNQHIYQENSSEAFRKNVFVPALQAAIKKHHWDVNTIGMLGSMDINIDGNVVKQLGYFPSPAMHTITPHDTLVVNAWDPLSIVGNGNANDNSLDGNIGKHTACGLLCFPPTNPYIKYKKIQPL